MLWPQVLALSRVRFSCVSRIHSPRDRRVCRVSCKEHCTVSWPRVLLLSFCSTRPLGHRFACFCSSFLAHGRSCFCFRFSNTHPRGRRIFSFRSSDQSVWPRAITVQPVTPQIVVMHQIVLSCTQPRTIRSCIGSRPSIRSEVVPYHRTSRLSQTSDGFLDRSSVAQRGSSALIDSSFDHLIWAH